MSDDPEFAELSDGQPASLTPWIVGILADAGIVRTKHLNLRDCILRYNSDK